MLLQDRRQTEEHRELRADFRAFRVVQACRGIALGLGGQKQDDVNPADIFPSLRALNFESDAPSADDEDESLALASFEHLRRSFRA